MYIDQHVVRIIKRNSHWKLQLQIKILWVLSYWRDIGRGHDSLSLALSQYRRLYMLQSVKSPSLQMPRMPFIVGKLSQDEYHAVRTHSELMTHTKPGSTAAVMGGCTCPRIDNSYGYGVGGDEQTYIISKSCEMHCRKSA